VSNIDIEDNENDFVAGSLSNQQEMVRTDKAELDEKEKEEIH
jgi:hypothetical protein